MKRQNERQKEKRNKKENQKKQEVQKSPKTREKSPKKEKRCRPVSPTGKTLTSFCCCRLIPKLTHRDKTTSKLVPFSLSYIYSLFLHLAISYFFRCRLFPSPHSRHFPPFDCRPVSPSRVFLLSLSSHFS